MRRLLVALGCAAMMMATGCDWIGGDKAPTDKPAAKPSDAKPADAKPADAKPADAKPAVDPAAVEQCGKILDKAWTAIQPGLRAQSTHRNTIDKRFKPGALQQVCRRFGP